jgi:hypothetical protein
MTDIDQLLETAAIEAGAVTYDPGYEPCWQHERMIFALSRNTGVSHEQLRSRLLARIRAHRREHLSKEIRFGFTT